MLQQHIIDLVKLSHFAKQNGGSQALVDKIVVASSAEGYKIGFTQGKIVGYKKGAVDTVIIFAITAGISLVAYGLHKHYIKKVIKRIHNVPSAELEETKKQIIAGIENYDKVHDGNDEANEEDSI